MTTTMTDGAAAAEAAVAKSYRLDNKRAVVTGGTKGIGLATVKELLALGSSVVFTARTEADVKALEAELRIIWGEERVKGVAADLADKADVARFATEAIAFCGQGRVDIVVQNAGQVSHSSSAAVTVEEMEHIFNVNFRSVFQLTQLFGPHMKRPLDDPKHFSSMVVLGSIAGQRGIMHGNSAYGATKAALHQHVRFMATEWAASGVRVNAVAPGFIFTPLTKDIFPPDNPNLELVATVPMRRVGQAEEIAGVIATLCMGHVSSYLTGQVITVDGGFMAQGVNP